MNTTQDAPGNIQNYPMQWNTRPHPAVWEQTDVPPIAGPSQVQPAADAWQLSFISFDGATEPRSKRKRQCQVCAAAGRLGYDCPGESNRKKCKFEAVSGII